MIYETTQQEATRIDMVRAVLVDAIPVVHLLYQKEEALTMLRDISIALVSLAGDQSGRYEAACGGLRPVEEYHPAMQLNFDIGFNDGLTSLLAVINENKVKQ